MITPSEIRKKSLRIYPQFVKSWLTGQEFFPRRVPANLKLPKELGKAKQAIELLRANSKQNCGYGYSIDWEPIKSRSHGLNDFPVAIVLQTQMDLLRLVNAVEEFRTLQFSVEKLRRFQPSLEPWLLESTHWKDLLIAAGKLDELLLLTQYLVDHPRPNCFAREIALPVSTKLIEENKKLLASWLDLLLPRDKIDFKFNRTEFEPRYGLRFIQQHLLFRVLDPMLQQRLGLRFSELSLPVNSINELQPPPVNVFVVENKVNLLTLPPISNSIAIGGLGKSISLFRDVDWLHRSNIYYWGDLDIEGFEILSQFREVFEHTESMLMDLTTFNTHSDLAIAWPNKPGSIPIKLSNSEQEIYHFLLHKKLRLEQERIPQEEIVGFIGKLALIM
ncbi:Wadjet anti-phage system protein JetD domain-containing protein [Gimesia maris]|jgi:hypothetical protein|uniref:Wadjet anti-phage system protein JetD domain-containing protein n=1 Tax=Gimesia maris TaxID=122 RepID=UPI0030DABE10|tara:strand:+ start:6270 stop:7436 length:1167 start_codon:yes stop_codon:yes gene_type:complete